MKKKLLFFILSLYIVSLCIVNARPFHHGPRPHSPSHRHCLPPRHYHSHYSHRHWVGPLVGGTVLGAALASAYYRSTPTVVTTPNVVYQSSPIVQSAPVVIRQTPQVITPVQTSTVYVPGHYETRIVNGVAVQTWVNGQYITR